MKPRPHLKHHPQQPVANLVPPFEEFVAFVMDNLGHSSDALESSKLSPKQKQRFKQMEWKADALDLDEYREILRQVLAPGLHDLKAESKRYVDELYEELRMFFKRYEILSWQVVPGAATRPQVLWALSGRFFVPWLALRIAYCLRDVLDIKDCWFIPRCGNALNSCVMKVIDRFVRHKDEPNTKLARRLYDHFPKQKRDAHATAFEGDLSKYSKFKSTPSDATIELIIEGNTAVPHLRLKLVLARFMDNCVRHAIKRFDRGRILEIVNFFHRCFFHFRSVVKQVCQEIPEAERNNVWLWLSSPTFMGNTPGEQDRFLPLMDEFANELSRKVNEELRRTIRERKSCRLPNNMTGMNTKCWVISRHVSIPEEIEGAPFHATVKSAVEASRCTFHGRADLKAAERARRRFEALGLGTFVIKSEGHNGLCGEDDAALADIECKRLFQLIYKRTSVRRRPDVALNYLVYLINPYRPKADEDRAMAQELFAIVGKHLRHDYLRGAANYLEGCLCLLENRPKRALDAFVAARRLGHESCGQFWIELLRRGLITAKRLGSKREEKNFAKYARLFGVFSYDPTPRTNELKALMKEDDYRKVWISSFKPFPQAF
jgi:hypothetical protein